MEDDSIYVCREHRKYPTPDDFPSWMVTGYYRPFLNTCHCGGGGGEDGGLGLDTVIAAYHISEIAGMHALNVDTKDFGTCKTS